MIRKLVSTSLITCLLIIGWTAWVITLTNTGLKLNIDILKHFIPGKLYIKNINGSLLGGFNLKNITYQDKDINLQVTMDYMNYSWKQPTPGLNGTWRIKLTNLKSLNKNVTGEIHGHGKISGGPFSPEVRGVISTKKINIAETKIKQVKVFFNISLYQGLRLRGSINTSGKLEKLIHSKNQWIKNPRGDLEINLKLQGFITHPTIIGSVNILNGSAHIPIIGINPKQIKLTATLLPKWKITFNTSFKSGEGTAAINGNIKNNVLNLKAIGDNIQIANLTHWYIVASPNINLKLSDEKLNLNGSIFIPAARLSSSEITGTVTLPDETVFTGTDKTIKKSSLATSLNLNIKLGDKIKIATPNLNALLKGKLKINQLPMGPITATGELYIAKGNNTFMAYGQTLQIRSGRLDFTGGPIANPGIDITAIKAIQSVKLTDADSAFNNNTGLKPTYTGNRKITVGARVTGTIKHPNLNLFSDPAMSQADILSYLAFGAPRANISGKNAGSLLTALSAINPSSSGSNINLTNTIQESLGIDELNIGSSETFDVNANKTVSTTSLMIGERLGPKLTLHYSIGIFNQISTLNLRYQFSKRWAIQSENSSIDNGGDILFGLERD